MTSQRKEQGHQIEAVAKADFDRDPQSFMRQSGPDRQIVVCDEAGIVHFAFGGSLAVQYCDDDDE